jgi:hypothetical protein
MDSSQYGCAHGTLTRDYSMAASATPHTPHPGSKPSDSHARYHSTVRRSEWAVAMSLEPSNGPS